MIMRREFGSFCILALTIVMSSETAAQSPEAIVSNTDEQNSKKEKIVLEASLSPTFTLDARQDSLRDGRGDRLQDATAESGLKLSYETELSDVLKLTADLGATTDSDWEPDDDDPSTSAFSARVRFDREFADQGSWEISGFSSVGFENERDNFFERELGNTITYAAGLSFVKPIGKIKFAVDPSIERVQSDNPYDDRWGPKIVAAGSFKIADRLKFKSSFTYQYRIFDIAASGSRRRHIFIGKSGLDYTREFARGFSLEAAAAFAVKVTDIEDTDILRDKADVQFNPSISLKKTW